jgi:hypothetical protein
MVVSLGTLVLPFEAGEVLAGSVGVSKEAAEVPYGLMLVLLMPVERPFHPGQLPGGTLGLARSVFSVASGC